MAEKKRDYEPFRQSLLALRARLRGDVRSMSEAAFRGGGDDDSELSHTPTHLADKGSDAFEQEFILSLVENEEETLGHIDAALERLRQGQYGTCADCGKAIPKARLEAIPYTAHCVHCASKLQS